MEHTLSFRRELKKLNNMPEQYLILADLMAVGHDALDAYIIAYPENRTYQEKQNKAILENILGSARFKKLLDARKSRIKEGIATPVSIDEIENIDKEEVAKEILRTAKAFPVDSKERADLLLKYADLRSAIEQPEEDNPTDSINFFFPLKCNQCPLLQSLNKMREEDGKQKIPAVEMDSIIRESVKKTYKDVHIIYELLHGEDYEKGVGAA